MLQHLLRTAVGAVAGVLVAAAIATLNLPASQDDVDPPVCYSNSGEVVPCSSWLWLAIAALVGLLVAIAVTALLRRVRSGGPGDRRESVGRGER